MSAGVNTANSPIVGSEAADGRSPEARPSAVDEPASADGVHTTSTATADSTPLTDGSATADGSTTDAPAIGSSIIAGECVTAGGPTTATAADTPVGKRCSSCHARVCRCAISHSSLAVPGSSDVRENSEQPVKSPDFGDVVGAPQPGQLGANPSLGKDEALSTAGLDVGASTSSPSIHQASEAALDENMAANGQNVDNIQVVAPTENGHPHSTSDVSHNEAKTPQETENSVEHGQSKETKERNPQRTSPNQQQTAFDRLYAKGQDALRKHDDDYRKGQTKRLPGCTFKPVLTSTSGKGAPSPAEKNSNPFERLYNAGRRTRAEQEAEMLKAAERLPSECTFSPTAVTSLSPKKELGSADEGERSRNANAAFARLYRQGQAQLKGHAERQMAEQVRQSKEFSFTPATNNTGRPKPPVGDDGSANSVRQRSSVYSRLYKQGKIMRKEHDERHEKHKLKRGNFRPKTNHGRSQTLTAAKQRANSAAAMVRLYNDGQIKLKKLDKRAAAAPSSCTFHPKTNSPTTVSKRSKARACLRLYEQAAKARHCGEIMAPKQSGQEAPSQQKGYNVLRAILRAVVDVTVQAAEDGADVDDVSANFAAYRERMTSKAAATKKKETELVDRLYGDAMKKIEKRDARVLQHSKDTLATYTFEPNTNSSQGKNAGSRAACARLYQHGIEDRQHKAKAVERAERAIPKGCTFSPQTTNSSRHATGAKRSNGQPVVGVETVLKGILAAVEAGKGKSRKIFETYSEVMDVMAHKQMTAAAARERKRRNKEEGEGGELWDKLYREGLEHQERMEKLGKQQPERCTFQPKTNVKSGQKTGADGKNWHEKLYESAADKRKQMKALRAKEQDEIMQTRLTAGVTLGTALPQGTTELRKAEQAKWESELTFHPKTNVPPESKGIAGDRFGELYDDAKARKVRVDEREKAGPGYSFEPVTNHSKEKGGSITTAAKGGGGGWGTAGPRRPSGDAPKKNSGSETPLKKRLK